MSFNARWRRPKIVISSTPNREEELSGGLRNALLRGENITKAKQSFINAGYKTEEVESASQKISTTIKTSQQTTSPVKSQPQKLQLESIPVVTKPKKLSKKFLIIISAIVLILIASVLLGLFWNKIF